MDVAFPLMVNLTALGSPVWQSHGTCSEARAGLPEPGYCIFPWSMQPLIHTQAHICVTTPIIILGGNKHLGLL